MKFLMVLWEAAGPRRTRLVLSVLASTLGTLGVLVVIDSILAPAEGADGGGHHGAAMLFVLAACGVIGGHAVGQRLSADIIEGLLDSLRVRLVELMRRTDYGRFEAIGGPSAYDVLSRNAALLTQAAMSAVHGVSAFGTLILGGFFTLTLSPLVFAAIAVLILASIIFSRLTQGGTRGALVWAGQAQERFYGLLRHLLGGFKEAKLNEPRGDDLQRDYLVPESISLRHAQIDAAVQINRGVSVYYVFFYLLIAVVAFVLPPLIGDQRAVAMSIYVAVYLLGTVEVILKAMPTVTRASFAVDELYEFERRLEAAARDEWEAADAADFSRISARDLLYSYRDAQGATSFTMGPTSLDIAKGELLFVVGGNGSGKSTLLKTLTRLYEPQEGVLLWDGVPVEADNVRAYRSLFSAVFADFHLFDRLYGMGDIPDARVNALLEELGVAHKTSYRDGRFTNTNLSTGQRKRLALAVALLEERPILVLDELAADQDPDFRRYFYDVLVPRWKAEGRTLVIVSHDDRYFHIADRTIILADGRIDEVLVPGEAQ